MYVHFSVYTYCYFQQAPKEKRKKIQVGAVMIAGYGTHMMLRLCCQMMWAEVSKANFLSPQIDLHPLKPRGFILEFGL